MIPISYNLHIEKDTFTIIPDGSKNKFIEIDRLSEEVTLKDKLNREVGGSIHKICGIWGMLKLISGHFLIVIKDIKIIGKLQNHDIYQVIESQIIPISRSNRHINDVQIALEAEYLQMLESVLRQEGFYFSPTGDLTHTLNRMQNVSHDFFQSYLLERADERFVWNRHLLANFVQSQDLQQFAIPIMHGFVGVIHNQLSRQTDEFELWIVSRRSANRAGTRYYSRGSDSYGNVSNYVETEQLLVTESQTLSFVQTRGSIPLVWQQKPNIYYKPNPQLSSVSEEEHVKVLKEHFNSQIYLHSYGQQIVVNLLNQSGSEKPLGSLFSRAINDAGLDKVKYVPFDFHHMCRKMRWDRLSVLIDTLMPDLEEMGYTQVGSSKGAQASRRQQGVVRTNCIDCLDRTNVVQSMVAWTMLERMLVDLGLLASSSSGAAEGRLAQSAPQLHFQYKNLWADNGDGLAAQYTGTGALKSDYTRTGKRTSAGVMLDGYKSAMRYVLNNFRDGFRQDSMELLLGNYMVDSLEGSSKSRRSPLQKPRSIKYKVIPWVVVMALSMIILRLLFPRDDWSSNALHLLALFSLLVVCMTMIFSNGYEFVDSPRLRKED